MTKPINTSYADMSLRNLLEKLCLIKNNEYSSKPRLTDCAVRPPLQERRGMSEANHSLSKCGDIRR